MEEVEITVLTATEISTKDSDQPTKSHENH